MSADKHDIFISKRNFSFDWKKEFEKNEVNKLCLANDTDEIIGLISVEYEEGFIFLPLIERANFGKPKKFERIAELLIAYACHLSFTTGKDGYVVFEAKTALIIYYASLTGALRVGNSNHMIIYPPHAKKMLNSLYEE